MTSKPIEVCAIDYFRIQDMDDEWRIEVKWITIEKRPSAARENRP
jgi:hypothetical protein